MNTFMVFVTVYAAIHLAEDLMKEIFEWLERWNKESRRKKNREISNEAALDFYWSLLEDELSSLGYRESRYSRKYDTMTFIGSENSIAVGADGRVYDCVTDEELALVTQRTRIVTEVTELWRKSVPASEDDMCGNRILARIGNFALAAKLSIFSGMDYTLLTYNGKSCTDEKALGSDYAFAMEDFALNILNHNISFLPADDELRRLKSDVIKALLSWRRTGEH